jgi:hypothetical protein
MSKNRTIADDSIESTCEKLRRSWPSPLVARSEVARFSGGVLHPRTMANLDSAGEGPPRVEMGRRIAYLRDGLIEWMLRRMTSNGRAGGRR